MKADGIGIQAYPPLGNIVEVGEHFGILHTVGIHSQHLLLHMVGKKEHQSVALRPLFHLSCLTHHILSDFAVMTHGKTMLVVAHRFGRSGKIGLGNYLAGEIHVETEARHNHQMVPELVGVFGRTKFRKEITHGAYYRLCTRRALVAVLDCKTEIHHPLDVSAIFR